MGDENFIQSRTKQENYPLKSRLNQLSQKVYQSIVDHNPDGVFALDLHGRFVDVNQAGTLMVGYSKEQLLGRLLLSYVPNEVDRTRCWADFRELLQGTPVTSEFDIIHGEGHFITISLTGIPVLDENEVIGIYGIIKDITAQKKLLSELNEAREQIKNILNSLDVFIWSMDYYSGKMQYCSPGVEKMFGISAESFLQDAELWKNRIDPRDKWVVVQSRYLAKLKAPFHIEYRVLGMDGHSRWVQTRAYPVMDAQRKLIRIDGVTLDITEQKQVLLALQRSQNRFQRLLDFIPTAVLLYKDWVVRYANKAASDMFSYNQPQALINQSVWQFIHTDSKETIRNKVESIVGQEEGATTEVYEHKLVKADGTIFYGETSSILVEDQGEVCVLSVANDTTRRHETDALLRHMAYYDPLTGLPNRNYFIERLSSIIQASEHNHTRLAILFIDMDRFKFVNDSFGHVFGDQVLKNVAKNMSFIAGDNIILARMGGDEFGILIEDVEIDDVAKKIAMDILGKFREPLQLEDHEFYITPSIGIALYPENGRDADTLLKHADIAMYTAKVNGGNDLQSYVATADRDWKSFIQLDTDLRKAIELNQFELYYQPKVDTRTRKVIGLEALIRWNRPGIGMVSPVEFISLAEENGFIITLGEWVLKTACIQAMTWQNEGKAPIVISVNVSPKQFQYSDMVTVVRSALKQSGLSGEWLEIEITESVLMRNSSVILCTLNELMAMGVRIAIDDFGTGYSSFSYLRNFLPQCVKIDQTFIKGMVNNGRDEAIVNALANVAHNLQMEVVAEGVETEQQVHMLQKIGCDIVQGYYFYQPLCVADVVEYLDSSSAP